MVCGHSICFRSNRYGQIGAAEPSEKMLISGSKSETLGQSGADWNNGNKNRKKVQYHCSTPTNSPCPHGLTACMSSSCCLSMSGRGISSSCGIRMLLIEIFLKIKVLVTLLQHLGTVI
jgi:hypothetical protein